MATSSRESGRSMTQSYTVYEIVRNVRDYFDEKFSHLPGKKRREELMKAVGIKSTDTLYKYLNREKHMKPKGPPPKIQDYDHETIRKIVYKFYEDGQAPNSQMIYDKFVEKKKEEDPDYQAMCRRTFLSSLQKIGFKYLVLKSNRNRIMNRPDLVEWRDRYLGLMKGFREQGYTEVITDETWFLTSDNKTMSWRDMSGKCEVLTDTTGHGKRFIIISAGTREGFIPNATKVFGSGNKHSADNHDDMNAALFEEWFAEDLLPNVPNKSVIILDNAPYHNRFSTKALRCG